MNADEIETRAAQLFAALGIQPDDIAKLVELGVSPDEKLHILWPENLKPELAATLLSLVGKSVLDVAALSRQAAAEADQAIRKAGGSKRLSFSPWLDPPKDESEWN